MRGSDTRLEQLQLFVQLSCLPALKQLDYAAGELLLLTICAILSLERMYPEGNYS